jgi:ATP-binding cassette subfamily F protein uup
VATSIIASDGQGRWIEYAGGYSDMIIQQRVVQRPASAVPGPKPQSERVARSAQPSRKLSFKDRHALDTLPAEMDRLRGEIVSLNKALADPQLYARDPESFARQSGALAAAQAALSAAEDRWLELEELRETLESR